jgi:hypothetical protein
MFLFRYRKKIFFWNFDTEEKFLFLVPALPALPAVAGIGAVGAGIKKSGIFANPSVVQLESQ